MGQLVPALLQVLIAGFFGAAGVAKLRAGGADVPTMRRFGASARLAEGLRWSLPAAEVGIAVLVAWGPTSAVGAVSALALLIAFTWVIVAAVRRGERIPCACFGATAARPLGPRSV